MKFFFCFQNSYLTFFHDFFSEVSSRGPSENSAKAFADISRADLLTTSFTGFSRLFLVAWLFTWFLIVFFQRLVFRDVPEITPRVLSGIPAVSCVDILCVPFKTQQHSELL